MRTPGNDVELAAGFLVSEGVISRGEHFRSAIHCGGPGTGGPSTGSGAARLGIRGSACSTRPTATPTTCSMSRSRRVSRRPTPTSPATSTRRARAGCAARRRSRRSRRCRRTTSPRDDMTLDAATLVGFPDALRAHQSVFDKTGGLHAAALFDAETGRASRGPRRRRTPQRRRQGRRLGGAQRPPAAARHGAAGVGPRELRARAEGRDGRHPDARRGVGAVIARRGTRRGIRADARRIPARARR